MGKPAGDGGARLTYEQKQVYFYINNPDFLSILFQSSNRTVQKELTYFSILYKNNSFPKLLSISYLKMRCLD